MSATTVTPLEALRRLIAEVKQLDAVEVGARWNQLQGELGVAEGVVRDFLNSDIIIANRLRDAAADPMWDSHAEVSKRLLTLAAENMEVARARIIELERAPVAAQPFRTALGDEVIAALEALHVGCTAQSWIGWQNGDGEEVGTRLQAAIDSYKAAQPSEAMWPPKMIPTELLKSINKHCCENVAWIQHAWMEYIAAAPTAAVSAAPSGEVEEQLRGEGWLRAMSDVSALLPNSYYMDPPDGGSVTVLEQVERMAKDAERYRYIRNTGTLDTLVWLALEGDGLVNDAGELDEEGYRRGLDRAVDISIKDAAKVAALSPDPAITATKE